jgi:hypothetical protein
VSGRKDGAPPAHDLEALAKEVAPHVVRILLEQLSLARANVDAQFSTREGLEPPEFVGRRRAWLATAKTIPGAIKIGRWWLVPRPAYAAWLTSRATVPASAATTTATSPANDAGDAWTPRKALLSVGIRPTREGSK